MAKKIADVEVVMDPGDVNRLKIAIDTKLKLVDKYLPSLKAVELQAEDGEGIFITKVERVIVDPPASDR